MITGIITYTGYLRTENTHVRSGTKLITDAPVDNKGKGEAFSPTDLLSTSLANCILTIMGMRAEEAGFSIDGAKAEMKKVMASDPRRVAEIRIIFDFSMLYLTVDQQTLLKGIPEISPVSLSLHPDVKQIITFNF